MTIQTARMGTTFHLGVTGLPVRVLSTYTVMDLSGHEMAWNFSAWG